MNYKENIYARFISGDLTNEEIQALKVSGEWEELEAINKATQEMKLPAYDKAAEFKKLKGNLNIASKKQSEVAPPVAKTRQLNWKMIANIAAGLLLMITGFFLMNRNNTAKIISAPIATTQTHNILDNTTVTLNDGSEISYNEKNWTKERKIQLTGEALFEVEKGSKFTVQTKNGEVEVLGTSFNVRAWDENLYVECYSGKVKVISQSTESILTTGQTVNIINGVVNHNKEITHNHPLWTNNMSRFHEENLNSVFKEVQRQFDVEVKTYDFKKSFSGTFSHDSIHQAMEQICKPMGLSFEIKNNGKTILVNKN